MNDTDAIIITGFLFIHIAEAGDKESMELLKASVASIPPHLFEEIMGKYAFEAVKSFFNYKDTKENLPKTVKVPQGLN